MNSTQTLKYPSNWPGKIKENIVTIHLEQLSHRNLPYSSSSQLRRPEKEAFSQKYEIASPKHSVYQNQDTADPQTYS